ncbi:thioesterase [Xenorhabdus sp. 42]|uniref:thioesterase II family protein n=1 Tax=Xenorhabdus szentirmaii TaxID=290112 RepID=UPI001996C6B6|nr:MULTISPECIES: alpha/beta fold hydrolase [unclassified Xenorhabdus]MBD2794154.1 thioesterase [Xenorhabdus sp. CUL]MBD2822553.1 thioesterase [Xenorhabdus sp. 42]MBD2826899.1 thioesterase [Xenorhabdus sp. 5]
MSNSVLFSAFKRPQAGIQLVFLHHAGSSCFSYMELASKLSESADIYCLELAGRGMRAAEPFQTDAEAVLSEILAAINHLKLGDDKPLLLFGHSLGAELAYQVARRLECESPNKKFALIISARGFVHPEGLKSEPCEAYSDDYVLNVIEQCNGTPSEVLSDTEMRNYLINIMRHDLVLLDSLSRLPKVNLNAQVWVIGGNQDRRVSAAQLSDWSRVLSASVEHKLFTGGHFYLFNNDVVLSWLEKEARALAQEVKVKETEEK